MSAQHTPGPWEFDVTEFGTAILAPQHDAPGNVVVADGVDSLHDARLIAAAPELLAALKALVAMIPAHDVGDMAHDWLTARAAIAKAEGR